MSHLPARPLRRRTRRALQLGFAAFVVAAAGSVFGSGTVLAEATVVSSDPADGSTIGSSPSEISIVFSEELGEQNTIGLECNTVLVSLGRLEVGADNLSITAPVPSALPKGTCVATWLVSDVDGEPNGMGNITFSVSADPAETTTTAAATDATTGTTIAGATTTPVDGSVGTSSTEVVSPADAETGQGPLWLGRLVSILGVAILFGSLVTIAAAWPEGVEYLVAVKFIRTIWIVAVIGTVLFVASATAAATGGSLGSGLNPANWMDLFDAGAPGIAAIARLILVLGSGWVAFRPDRVIDPTTQMAGLGIPALAVATIGFSRTGGDLAVIGMAMGVLHALAMAIWIGGVVLLARVVLAGPGEEDLVHAVRGFCRISNVAIVVTVVTGLVQTVRLDGGDLFGSSHGRVLLLKTIAVAVMLFIAIKARQFVNERLARADEMTVPMADRLRRAFGTEAAIGILAVALSAWMLALTPANVDAGSSITYVIERQFEVPEADLDITVKLTSDLPGLVGMEVDVDAPEADLSGLEIVFTAPANDEIGTITQPVPLTGAGVAVRLAADGLPLTVPGGWKVQINAVTATGVVTAPEQTFVIRNDDGSTPTTNITIPPVTIAPITPSTTTTVPG
ncbi:MAG: CopD family protein [Ilumatobacteraceae bacterium]